MDLEDVDILTKSEGESRYVKMLAEIHSKKTYPYDFSFRSFMWQETDGSWTAVYVAPDLLEVECYIENWPTKAQALLYLLTDVGVEEIRKLS